MDANGSTSPAGITKTPMTTASPTGLEIAAPAEGPADRHRARNPTTAGSSSARSSRPAPSGSSESSRG